MELANSPTMLHILIFLVSLSARAIRAMCRCRADLVIENLALRQQVTRAQERAPAPTARGRRPSLLGGAPPIVANVGESPCHRQGRYRCAVESGSIPTVLGEDFPAPPTGRPRVDTEIRQLIRTMAQDGWGAPRIHAELTKLGFVLSEKTVSRYLPRRPVEPDQVKRWIAFLSNHKDDIAAMDLFTVPTISLRLLYGFFIIEHGRRRILHFNATFHPTAAWVIQQLRKAFPYDSAPKHLIFDRDSIFSAAVVEFIKAMGTKPVRISYRSPWQNGYASHCTSSVRFGRTSGGRRLSESLVPCCLTGAFSPGFG